jgi:FMN reductase
MTTRTIAVLAAGLSEPSSTRLLADQLADATRRQLLAEGADVELVVLELRDLAHDVTNKLVTGFTSAALQTALDAVAGADGVIAVSPLFNASYSGLFKSFVDVLDVDTLRDKPVLVAATGGSARHSLALDYAMRPLFSYLHAVVAPTAVFAASADWGTGAADGTALSVRIERAGAEFATLLNARPHAEIVDPFADVTPFSQLLGGSA